MLFRSQLTGDGSGFFDSQAQRQGRGGFPRKRGFVYVGRDDLEGDLKAFQEFAPIRGTGGQNEAFFYSHFDRVPGFH